MSQRSSVVSLGVGRRIAAPGALCRDTSPAPPITIQMIVSRHTPAARPCARAAARPARRSALSWPLTGRVAPGHACPCAPMSQYSLLYRDSSSENGQKPSQPPLQIFFFHSSFFFLCSSYCKTIKKKKKKFHVFSRTK